MATMLRIQGYSGSLKLDLKNRAFPFLVSMLSYDLTISRKIMDSEAHWGFYQTQGFNTHERFKGVYLDDCPEYGLDVSFDLTLPILEDIVAYFTKRREEAVSSIFADAINDIYFEFDEMYISGVSFGVSENETAVVNMSFILRESRVKYLLCSDIDLERKSTVIPFDDNNKLMPYYFWGLVSNLYAGYCVTSFTLDWRQNLTPMYECGDSDEELAPAFAGLVFGVPEISLSLTTFMCCNLDIDFDKYVGTQLKTNGALDAENMVFNYNRERIFELTGLVVKSYAPGIVTNGWYNSRYEMGVYGILKE